MLTITIPAHDAYDLWDQNEEKFIPIPAQKEQKLQLEHSLVSLSKWESKWHKPFLSKKDKTDEETIDYIRCMTVTPNVSDDVYYRLTRENIDAIYKYINDPMTATTFPKEQNGSINRETVTAELIYYWMIAQNIPFECQKWHLEKLLTLIRVCNVKNAPPKKRNQRDINSRHAAINRARRAKMNAKG